MPKKIEEQLKILQKTVMDTEEKSAIRNAVVSYTRENPILVRKPDHSRLQYGTSDTINNKIITKTRMTIALIIALLLSGGTSFAAESALPGDILYPIKVNVNEKAQEIIAVSNESETKVQAKLAGRRLEEAEKLAVSGKLNAETSKDLKARFEEHSNKAKEYQTKAQEEKGTGATASLDSDFEISLGMHEKLLGDIANSKPEMKGYIDGILGGVQIHLKEASDDRTDFEAKAFVGTGTEMKASAEGALKAAQNKIDEVKKFIEPKKDSLNAGVKAGFDAQMKVAESMIVEGTAKIEAQEYVSAFELFKKASREAQSAKLFVIAADNLNVQIEHSNVLKIESKTESKDNPQTYQTEEKIRTTESISDDQPGTSSENGTVLKVEGGAEAYAEAGGVSGSGGSAVQIEI